MDLRAVVDVEKTDDPASGDVAANRSTQQDDAQADAGFDVRRAIIWGLPAAITLGWVLYVTVAAQWGRVFDLWESSLTMVFGSFVAGSTPQGGGAVAFPVFTKGLEIPAEVARTFSLSIQAVGMVTASAIIVLARRPVDARAVVTGGVAGIGGFLVGLFVLGKPASLFWAASIPPSYVKVTFTIVIGAMAFIVWTAISEDQAGSTTMPRWNYRFWILMAVAGLAGGVASALTGSGVDVFVFLFVVVLVGVHPRLGVPTSILAMAFVSVFAFFVLGLGDGQLSTQIDSAGNVVAVGGTPTEPLPGGRFDLFGLWLAAVPIVVWGAPLGAYFVHVLREGRLIAFLAAIATLEVVTTVLFLDELHTNRALQVYGLLGLVGAIVGVSVLHRYRRTILHLDAAPATSAEPSEPHTDR